MIRRWLTAALTGALLLGTAMPAAADSSPAPIQLTGSTEAIRYNDVTETHWAYWQVAKLREANILSASPDGLFRPDDPIRRAELFKMILGARRIDTNVDCGNLFEDVPCDAWFAPAVETAYRMAIAEGKGAGLFQPDVAVTRQELFTIMVRSLGKRWEAASLSWAEINTILDGFADQKEIAYWARPSIAYAVKVGLTKGYEDSTFRPEAVASRAEAAAVVSKVLIPKYDVKFADVGGRQVAYKQAMDMIATKYATGEPGVGTTTYTGVQVRIGTVAVDPTVIPLGSLLFIEGYGYAVAADIGSAIKGMRVDLYTYNYDEAAYHFGMQPRKVWILP